MSPLLDVTDLRVTFATPRGDVKAVQGVSLSLEQGKTLGIVGESGSGKTVLSRAIMGLLPLQGVTQTGEAQSNGRPQEKDFAFPRRHATQPPSPPSRAPRRVPELRRAEAATSRLQPLRLLRRARDRGGRKGAEGRCPGLTPGRGVASERP